MKGIDIVVGGIDRPYERVYGAGRHAVGAWRCRRALGDSIYEARAFRARTGRQPRRGLYREGDETAASRVLDARLRAAGFSGFDVSARSGAMGRLGGFIISMSTTPANTDVPDDRPPRPAPRESGDVRPRRRSRKFAAPRQPASMTFAATARSGKLPHFDDLLFLGASISRYPLEGYRERCGTDVVLGAAACEAADRAANSYHHRGHELWRLSAQAKEALGRGATIAGTCTTTGDGGMTPEEREHSQTLVYQYLPTRYGMNPDDLRAADAIEIVIGQGAKPGGGGMLLGQKISDARRSHARRCRQGSISARACRHPDWTGPDDLEIKIEELREITDWQKPIYVKVGAVAALLRHGAGGEGRRRCGRARRHAGRHRRRRRTCSSSMSACRSLPRSGRRCRRCRISACTAGAADRLRRHQQWRRRRQGAGARRRCGRRSARRR